MTLLPPLDRPPVSGMEKPILMGSAARADAGTSAATAVAASARVTWRRSIDMTLLPGSTVSRRSFLPQR
jgi:hypothetical protein